MRLLCALLVLSGMAMGRANIRIACGQYGEIATGEGKKCVKGQWVDCEAGDFAPGAICDMAPPPICTDKGIYPCYVQYPGQRSYLYPNEGIVIHDDWPPIQVEPLIVIPGTIILRGGELSTCGDAKGRPACYVEGESPIYINQAWLGEWIEKHCRIVMPPPPGTSTTAWCAPSGPCPERPPYIKCDKIGAVK
jgi:hypothetical protein